ncbi:MAG: ABC transporter ATP-binding protein [Caldilineaceae bacterium]|nr:ABC transporter ATP-binding protein [Caldilineaceae bacterium]
MLQIKNLHVHYLTADGAVQAVRGVDFTLNAGQRLALVGESGCGKTTLALAIMRLLRPPAQIVEGEIWLDGRNLLALNDEEMRLTRLADVSLVTQAAMNALNPVMRIEDQIIDGLQDHGIQWSKDEFGGYVRSLLANVGLDASAARMFPHELSGGMKQRVGMATATALKPKLIIADEPTSALDVVVQRQVMTTLGRLQRETGAAVILVGHDMGLVAQFADWVGVMYAGKLVELSPVEQIVQDPQHPYSKLLIQSVPGLEEKRERLIGIPGMPPRLIDLPSGCLFAPRCPSAMEHCLQTEPSLEPVAGNRQVACYLYAESYSQNNGAEVNA